MRNVLWTYLSTTYCNIENILYEDVNVLQSSTLMNFRLHKWIFIYCGAIPPVETNLKKMSMAQNIPVEKMYEQRQNFTIVALTGITGSGCSDFAELMHSQFIDNGSNGWGQESKGLIRKLEELPKEKNKRTFVFKREYETCLKYCQNYKVFEIIKYKNVLLFHMFRSVVAKHTEYEKAKQAIVDLISYKFHHAYNDKSVYEKYKFQADITAEKLENWGYTKELHDSFRNLTSRKDNKDDLYKEVSSLFFERKFEACADNLYSYMKEVDYFAKNFFSHRLACAIRATGDPEKKYEDYKDNFTTDHIFDLVELINQIIKGYHRNKPEEPRRFVIDSIRNSMEILYLRERYNSFYMIALHNDGKEKKMVKTKVKKYAKGNRLSHIVNNIMKLSAIETKHKDFENGKFFAPDISRCVSESELHIAFRSKEDLQKESKDKNNMDITSLTFYTYAEQWMKFFSLISRPGIITPSRDERCMSIAYVAKFNSGCISRQVGCAIVDKENAVQSVGWNDPPASQIPCNLRYADELQRVHDSGFNKDNNESYRIYSKFELNDTTKYEPKDDEGKVKFTGLGFCDSMQKTQNLTAIKKVHSKGLPYPYCFRSQYNSFTGNKDQVNTRSLHAEENTMLRIAHRGGTPLDGGTMYVTASPCVLCSKKAYQIGIRDIVYLDPYTDIAPDLILHCGFDQPRLRVFTGAIGSTFYKLYQPFLPLKDELAIYEKTIKPTK